MNSCVSPWLARIIFSVNTHVYRAGMSCFRSVFAMQFRRQCCLSTKQYGFLCTLLYSFCISRATDGEWWKDIKKLKHTAFLPHSQLLAQEDFLKLVLRRVLFQTFWTSSPFSFTHTSFCLSCVLSRFGPMHTVFVYCFCTHNSPH